jgi:hypothetical protein
MQGNKVVFAELAGAFAAFIDAFSGRAPTGKPLSDLLDKYKPGPPMPDTVVVDTRKGTAKSTLHGGQSLLRDMLLRYHDAMLETDAARKAQLIMLASAEGGLHEQTRLQNYIASSINVPIDMIIVEAVSSHATAVSGEPSVLHRLHAAVHRAVHPLTFSVRALWASFSTLELMKMRLPDGTLRLGHDLPSPPGLPLFPKDLESIGNPALQQLLNGFGALAAKSTESDIDKLAAGVAHLIPREFRGGGVVGSVARHWSDNKLDADLAGLASKGLIHAEVAGSAAHDWAVLSQRMHFILEYFRSRQQDPTLVDQPFSAEQRAAIAVGKVPGGPL